MTIRRILAAVDASEPARRAAERALWLASRCGAEVTMLHVFEMLPEEGVSLLSASSFEEHSRRTAEVDMRRFAGELNASGLLGSGVEIVSAVEPRYHELSVEAHREATQALHEQTAAMAGTLFGDDAPQTVVVEGTNVVDALTAYAERTSADLLVLSTHGRTGLRSVFMGSVAERLTRFAPCSVLVVRSTLAQDS